MTEPTKWKSINISGFEHYIVSTSGEVLNTVSCKKVKGWSNRQGYKRVKLCSNGFVKQFYIHRLVLITFEGVISEDYEVHHLNNERCDNSLYNLKWVTRQENMSYVHGNCEPVECIDEPMDGIEFKVSSNENEDVGSCPF